MRQKIIFLISLIAITMFGIFKNQSQNHTENDLKKLIKDGAFLVDVRTPEEFAEGSVTGSINIPLDVVADNLKLFDGKSHIIVFCRSGNRSGQAKSILEQNGYTNVSNGGTWQHVSQLINH